MADKLINYTKVWHRKKVINYKRLAIVSSKWLTVVAVSGFVIYFSITFARDNINSYTAEKKQAKIAAGQAKQRAELAQRRKDAFIGPKPSEMHSLVDLLRRQNYETLQITNFVIDLEKKTVNIKGETYFFNSVVALSETLTKGTPLTTYKTIFIPHKNIDNENGDFVPLIASEGTKKKRRRIIQRKENKRNKEIEIVVEKPTLEKYVFELQFVIKGG